MDVVALIKQATEQTKQVVVGVDPSRFDDPTPCSEYNVEQLADHITSFRAVFDLRGHQVGDG